MIAAFRRVIRNTHDFLSWSAEAKPRDTVAYHIGNIGTDRAQTPELHMLAETVMLLQETGWVIGSQIPMHMTVGMLTSYFVTRTGSGTAPRALMMGTIDALEYRALRSLKERDADQSATRAIRDGIRCSEHMAADYLAVLFGRKFIMPGPERGWQPSPAGLRALT
jgi:hypothetical protein